jgi:hypothetical protein
MKKTKLTIIGVVVALLLVGGAYAVWASQANLLVNAGSGELDIEISKVTVGEVSKYVEFDRDSITVSEDKKSETIAIGNMYPGSSVEFETTISNTGTIPVKLDKITHTTIEVIDKDTNTSLGLNAEVFADFQAAYSVRVLDENGKILDTLSGYTTENQTNWTEDLYANNDLKDIPSGGSLVVNMKVYLEKQAKDITENKLFKFSVTPFFIQSN